MNSNLEYGRSAFYNVEEVGHTCGVVVAIAALAAGVAYLISKCK